MPMRAPQHDAAVPTSAASLETEIVYRSKKPKWWIQLSGRASKGQRRATREMKSHQLLRPPFGAFIDWSSVFGGDNDDLDVSLEIGFGSGENLLRLAEQYHYSHPGRFFVGAEIHPAGIGKALLRIQEGILKKRFWTDYKLYSQPVELQSSQCDSSSYIGVHDAAKKDLACSAVEPVENPYSNLRIHPGDGIKILPYIATATLSSILITNPDPFPEQHNTEFRVIQTHIACSFRRVLRPGGCLYLATDDQSFYDWSLRVLDLVHNEEGPLFRRKDPCPDRQSWLPVVSNYEQKGLDNGRQELVACWEAIHQ
jgi:tRNA (guanine-N7-)-methyltransferase